MIKKNIYIFSVILGLLILSSGFSIYAQTINPLYNSDSEIQDINQQINDNEEKINNLKEAAKEYAKKIEEYKDKSASLKNQIELLDNQIIKMELDIKTTQLQIDKAKLEIKSMEFTIGKGEKEISLQRDNLGEYLKLIHKNDQKSYLEILILNDSFSEFFSQVNYLSEIQKNIQNAVTRLQLVKSAVTLQKTDKEQQMDELESLKEDLSLKEDKLKEENRAKETLLLETKSSEIKFSQLLTETKLLEQEITTEVADLKTEIQEKIKQLRQGSSSPQTTLTTWPIDPPHTVTSYFHDPDYPYRYIFEHPAVDLRAAQGTQIKAPAPGYVAKVKNGGYGYSYIILIHDNGISTVYGHVSAIYVSEDSFVKEGDIIGLTGGAPGTKGAGNLTSGSHLHFEVRLDGIPVNPLEFLP